MIKFKLIFVLFIVTILFYQCKKDDENWTYCVDCNISSWVGTFEGIGIYYSDTDGNTISDVPTIFTIDSSSATVLKTTVIAEDYFTTSFTVNKTDDNYYINVPGSNQSLNLTLSKRGAEFKLSGTVKIHHYQSDILFTDHSISFETFKYSEN